MKNLSGEHSEPSFNLIDSPWVPIIDMTGTRHLVGLRELYETADQLKDLSAGPPQRIAIMRLLLCITQAALNGGAGGPQNEEEWEEKTYDLIVPESLVYLEKWRDRFDLFGEHPFLQVPQCQLAEVGTTSTDKLDFGLSTGNNDTLFDQESVPEGRAHSDAWLARQLVMYQTFSTGGRIGVATWNSMTTGNGSSTDAPAIEGSMLLSILQGSSLLETIYWNIVPIDVKKNSFGRPVWEYTFENTNTVLAKEVVVSYLGRLIPFSRVISIHPDRQTMTLANGFPYPKLPIVREPMGTLLKGKKDTEVLYLRADPAKHPWRNLCAVLTRSRENSEREGPKVLAHLEALRDKAECGKIGQKYELFVGGILSDKAKILDAPEWTFALRFSDGGENFLGYYEKGVQYADHSAFFVGCAVKKYLEHLKMEQDGKKPGSMTAKSKTLFWAMLDVKRGELLQAARREDLSTWRKLVWETMLDAYQKTCPRQTPRQIQAYTEGLKCLSWSTETKKEKKTTKSKK